MGGRAVTAPKLYVGQRVKLSREGWRSIMVDGPEMAEQAREMRITELQEMGKNPDGSSFYAVEVDQPLINSRLLCDSFVEPLPDPEQPGQGHAIVLTDEGPQFTWTRLYHGVTHMLGLPKHLQITCNQYGSFAIVKLFNRNISCLFTQRQETCSSLDEAKALGEKWGREMMR